ncbi:MAG: alpha/beta hydrolase [Rhodobacterales bacterium]
MKLLKISAGACLLYIVCILLIALVQDRLLFPRWAMGGQTVALPATAERLSIEIEGVGPLAGAFLPADRTPPPGAALVLGFGVNAWDADHLAVFLSSVFPARNVVVFHYRGYGPSAGHPSADALLEDAVRIHDEVIAVYDPDHIVAIGLSVGAGPAAHLASQRALAGVVLVTPFDSLEALAADLYPWLPVRLLLRHRMDVAGALSRSSAKVAIIAAAHDEIVPSRRTEALRQSAENVVSDRVIEGAGHNDIYNKDEFVAAMGTGLNLIEDLIKSHE